MAVHTLLALLGCFSDRSGEAVAVWVVSNEERDLREEIELPTEDIFVDG